MSHLYLFLVSSSTYLLNDLCISGLIFLSSIWIKYFVILLRRKFLNSTHYLRLTNRLNEFRILCSLCCYDCLSLCKDTQSRKQSQEKRVKIFLEKTIWCMWRGGDITVLPLKIPLKSSYPDRGTHVPRPRYTCIPTEVHMYPDRGTITLKPVSHDITACFA